MIGMETMVVIPKPIPRDLYPVQRESCEAGVVVIMQASPYDLHIGI